jgi:hypothetical protein
MRLLRPLGVMTVVVSVLALPGIAMAQWAAGAAGVSSAVAVSMPSGGSTSASASGHDVTIAWTEVTFLGGGPVGGYEVLRYDAIGGGAQSVGAGCGGTLTSLTCVESNVPNGSWQYAVRPVQDMWVGAEGSRSAIVSISPSSAALSLASSSISSLPGTVGGTVTGFATGETVTFRLDDPATGTVLPGSSTPSPIQSDGAAAVTLTVPGGTPMGAHTVYAVGSLGTTSSAAVSVADQTAPGVSAAVISKTQGGATALIRQGGTYYVYASVTDPGDPVSGIASVTADVSSITIGGLAVALTPGAYAVGGSTYGFRSAPLAASTPLPAGSVGYSVTAIDASGNAATWGGFSATVDDTPPTGSDVQTANKVGGVAGKAESGDSITFTFSEPIEPDSVLAGWLGSATGVTVHLINQNGSGGDQVQVWSSADTAQLPLGTVRLARNDYTTAAVTFTASSMTMTGSTITIVLGSPSGTPGTASVSGTMQWTPASTPIDLAGNTCSTTTVNETGTADIDF